MWPLLVSTVQMHCQTPWSISDNQGDVTGEGRRQIGNSWRQAGRARCSGVDTGAGELFSSAQSRHTIYKLADALNSTNKVSKAWQLRAPAPHRCLALSITAWLRDRGMCPVWLWPPFQLYTGAETLNKLSGGKHSRSTRQVELRLNGPPPSQLWSSCVFWGAHS